MKKKVLMSLVLLAIIGTSAVFAQEATMDKLKWIDSYSVNANESSTRKRDRFQAINTSISGELIIPGTYNGNPTEAKNFQKCDQLTSVILLDGTAAIATGAFSGCTNLASITIPISMNIIDNPGFGPNLTSVTFKGNVVSLRFSDSAFPGDLVKVFKSAAGGAGTYTRQAGSNTWTKSETSVLQPTMDKLKWIDSYSVNANESSTRKRDRFQAINTSISGELIIPGTYNGNPTEAKNFQKCDQLTSVILLDGTAAIATGAFSGCTNLASITIPASMNIIDNPGFGPNLTSVTFKGNTISVRFGASAFPGDLVAKFNAGGAGTYTRQAGSNTWTKQ